MDGIQAVSMAASAAGGAALTLLALYRFFTPRDRCDQRHKQVHDLANKDTTRAAELGDLRASFAVLRRDVRWQGSTMRAIADHLGVVVPEEPGGD